LNKTDSIVESVINQFRQRSELGIKKYGTTLAENNTDDFLEHTKQELMDAVLYIEKLQSQSNNTNKTNVFIGKAQYERNAYLHILGNTVVFDCSDDEYGPIEFPLELLKQKIKEHAL